MRAWTIALVYVFLQGVNAQSFIKNNVGNLQFTQQFWEFQQVLNITKFEHTSRLLEQCTETLKIVCHNSENELCNYFIKTVKNINLNIESDIAKLNSNMAIREKREITLITVALVSLGTSIITAVISYFMYSSALENVKSELNEHLNLFEKAVKAN